MLANIDSLGHFDALDKISKYKLGPTTLDKLDVDSFYNTKFSTIFWYLNTWVLMILSWVLLGSDMYTCVNILAFGRWSSDDYKPYAYGVAKWIFTGCIIFEFCLLFYHWFWAIKVYRTRNVALLFITNITRVAYSIRSYKYHCLFNAIDADDSYDWCCLFAYTELDTALQILVADTPRQVINVLTLRYYATGGGASNDVIANIRILATSNIPLAVILSIMCLSVIIWSIFMSKFIVGIILYVYVKPKLYTHGSRSLKKYCCSVVNHSIQTLSRSHFKSRSSSANPTQLFLRTDTEDPFASTDTLFKLWDAPADILLDFKYKQASAIAPPRPLRQALRPARAGSGIQMLDLMAKPDPFETAMSTPPRQKNLVHENYRRNEFGALPNPQGEVADYVPGHDYDSTNYAHPHTYRRPVEENQVYRDEHNITTSTLLLHDSVYDRERSHTGSGWRAPEGKTEFGSIAMSSDLVGPHNPFRAALEETLQSTDSLAPLTYPSNSRSRRPPPPGRQMSDSDLYHGGPPLMNLGHSSSSVSVDAFENRELPARTTLVPSDGVSDTDAETPYPVRGMSLYKADRY